VVVAGRAGELEQIVDRFVQLAVGEREHEVAEVRSAVALSDADVDRLREALSRATRKNVEVKVVVDPTVMGGIVTKMGDLVIDGSVRHRLDQLREQI
jgi:F-type H+-transporting ATPase subunit delta